MKLAAAILTIFIATPAVAGNNAAFNNFDPMPPEAVQKIEAGQRQVTYCMFENTNKPYKTVEDVNRIVQEAAQGPCLEAIKQVEAQLGTSRSEQWWMDFEMMIKAAHYGADDGGINVGP